MLSWLTDPFSGEILQRAFLELIIVSLTCAPLGVWVLLYRQSYAAESVSHAMLPGLVIASLAGVSLVFGAIAGVVAGSILIAWAVKNGRVSSDSAVGVVTAALVGFGALLALSSNTSTNIHTLLFGDLLGVSGNDVITSGAIGIILVLALVFFHRKLVVVSFDPNSSKSLGVSVNTITFTVLILIGIATIIMAQALGTLLLFALIIAPGLTALAFTRRLALVLWLSALIAVADGAMGIIASFHLNIAAGASVAGVAAVTCLITIAARRSILLIG